MRLWTLLYAALLAGMQQQVLNMGCLLATCWMTAWLAGWLAGWSECMSIS